MKILKILFPLLNHILNFKKQPLIYQKVHFQTIHLISLSINNYKTIIDTVRFKHMLQPENPLYTYKLNPDLSSIDWEYVVSLFYKINWKQRKTEEIAAAFKNSTTTIFIFKDAQIIAFGRVVGDGRYYAMLADIVVDPDFQGQGLGKYLVTTLNKQLVNYHFVNLSAAPGADKFYKSLGWKKQTTAFIWPQGPKQLRQHCEVEEVSPSK